MPIVCTVGDLALTNAHSHSSIEPPHPCVGPAVSGSPNVMVGGRPVLRLLDPGVHFVCLGPNQWRTIQGSSGLWVNDLPVVRVGDKTEHCLITVGEMISGNATLSDNSPGVSTAPSSAAAFLMAIAGQLLGSSTSSGAPTAPPTAVELQRDPVVSQALQDAWNDSMPGDPSQRHEEGGWIYQNTTTGEISVIRAPAGAQASLDLSSPPVVPGSVVVGKFHTHPNPTSEGWAPGPSSQDIYVDNIHGVPDLIQSDSGVFVSGPDSRDGGLGGGPGYPP